MGLFKRDNNKLTFIKKTEFENEREIHNLVKDNLGTLFKFKLIENEFRFSRNIIDTLAFDEKRKIFIIIEYKITKDKRLAGQILSYSGSMHKNKHAFIQAYNRKSKKHLRENQIDWGETRILVIAPEFVYGLREALADPKNRIELWKINCYKRNIIEFKGIKYVDGEYVEIDPETGDESIEGILEGELVHLEKCDDEIRELYRDIREQILKLGNVDIEGKKYWIAFKTNRVFVEFRTSKKRLRVHFTMNRKEINRLRDSNWDYGLLRGRRGGVRIYVSKKSEIPDFMKLVEQSYKKTRRKRQG